jgi:hypothetical protein
MERSMINFETRQPRNSAATRDPLFDFTDTVLFHSPEAKGALLRGELCRIALAVFPNQHRIIAIGLSGNGTCNHREILATACSVNNRLVANAVEVGGTTVIYLNGRLHYALPRVSETLQSGIRAAHQEAILKAVEEALTSA